MKKIWNFFEKMNEFIYVSDMENYEMIYMNKKLLEICGFHSLEEISGKKCYEVLYNSSKPCENCTNHELSLGNFKEWSCYNAQLGKNFAIKDTMVEEDGRRCRVELALDADALERESRESDRYRSPEQGADSEETFSAHKKLSLTDLISVEMLQNIQDAFSNITGMAALTTERDGVPVTKGSNFTDFCMKHTRTTEIGMKRCFECDKKGAEIALETGKSCAYECHAGLVDFAAPIVANGEMFGCFIGGQVLTEKPDKEKVAKIAEEIGVDVELYQKAIDKINVIDKESIDRAAAALYTIANVLSDIAYNKYMLNERNALLRQKNMELDFLANYDQLTKLSNRHYMQHHFEQFQKSDQPYCVVIADIDNFKQVNDIYGHGCGDLVLSTIADIIKKKIDDQGVVARWGGEEFLILLYGDKKTAGKILESVRQKIEANSVYYQEQDVRVTMTFGLAFCQEHNKIDKLVTLADDRLYYGKNHGKNTIVLN